MNPKIAATLLEIYGEQEASEATQSITALIEKYEGKSPVNFSLSEKDVALITYGDQVTGPVGSNLSQQHQLLQKYLRDAISIVHILPFYPYSSDDGFSVKDYYAVRDEVGSWGDVQQLAGDYKLMFDAVINHMSSESDWFQYFLQGKPGFETFFFEGSDFDGLDKVVRPRTSPLHHEFIGKKVWTTFSADQIDLNFSDLHVLLQILDVLLFYVQNGASLLRLDAIGFLWKKENTSCMHLPETHAVIKLMRQVIESVAPQVLLITETNVPHDENISYFGSGDEAHMVYNFTLPPLLAFSVLNESTEKLKVWAKSLSLPHENTCFFNFLSSHDGVGLRPVTGILDEHEIQTLLDSAEASGGKVSYRAVGETQQPYEINCTYFSLLQGDESDDLAIKRMLLAHAILLVFPGLPAIYFHSFFGMRNDLEGLYEKDYNRAINRQKFQYEEIDKILSDERSVQRKVLEGIKRLIEIRQRYEQFHPYANFRVLDCEEGLFGLSRSLSESGDSIKCYFNLTHEAKEILIDGESFDLLTGKQIAGVYKLNGLDFVWLNPKSFQQM